MLSKRTGALFFGALCCSYVVLCGNALAVEPTIDGKKSAPAIKITKKPAATPVKKTAEAVEFSDSWKQKSVFDRAREEYASDGARVGMLIARPSLTLEEAYNSNIYATQNNADGDLITKINPTLSLDTDWSRHAFSLSATGDIGQYSDNVRESFRDYNVSAAGRLDVMEKTYILGSASTAHLHEDRGSPDSVTTSVNPTVYSQTDAGFALARSLRRFSLRFDGDYRNLNYDNGETSLGAVITNNDRDRDEYKETLRLGYEIIPEYEAFVKTILNQRDYDWDLDSAGVNRDSSGYEVEVGTAVNISGKTKGEVFVGYMSQDYDSVSLKDIDAVQFGGSLLWNASDLTSVRAGITRGVIETTITAFSGAESTLYSLSVEREIRYNILGRVGVSYETNDYEGFTTALREDKIAGFGSELKYLLNRNMSLVAKYNYSNRDSNVVGQDFDRSVVSAGFKLEM